MIDSGRKVNILTSAYTLKLDSKVYYTNVKAQKINALTLKMFKIVLASFNVEDKLKRPRFFQKSFLLADIKIKIVQKMFFLTLSGPNILFLE